MEERFINYLRAKWNTTIRRDFISGNTEKRLAISEAFIHTQPNVKVTQEKKEELVAAAMKADLKP